MIRAVTLWVALAASANVMDAFAEGNAGAGKEFFEQQCIGCHSAAPDDNGGNQGPSLVDIVGRPAASDKQFSYTKQLTEAKLVWDAATLDRFLSAPDKVVPGTAMVIAVTNQSDRDNLIAYLQSLASTNRSAAARFVTPYNRIAKIEAHTSSTRSAR